MKKYIFTIILLILFMPFIVTAKSIDVGDYIYAEPYARTYTVSNDITGYSSTQTIKPNELSTWRVIKKNNDGTMDAVSEYLSSDKVCFHGTIGYAKYVNALNIIAQQYSNSYTKSTRIIGFDGQTEIITNTSTFDGTSTNIPSTSTISSPTSGTGREYQGGIAGDTLYLKDYLLVSNTYKDDTSRYGSNGMIAYVVNTNNSDRYYLASRMYRYVASVNRKFFGPRMMSNDNFSYGTNVQNPGFRNSWEYYDSCSHLRPIITIREDIGINGGEGTLNNPYSLKILEKNNIIIQNDNSKGIMILSTTTNVLEDSIVSFVLTPNRGYIISSFNIKDSKNNTIAYQSNNFNEYSFIMPDSDVTITPVYEKVKNNIDVEIKDETKELNINIEDLTKVVYEEEVNFKITPIKGYKINNIKIVDDDNNEIEYITTDNENYKFTMPASNVTIIPSYERVSNAVNIEENKSTKEFVIEVNDSKAVVYEDTVKFRVEPEVGYEIERIEIKDEEDNIIEYRKTDKENEYEFTMPATDVVITPTYKKIESINVPDTLKNPNTGTGISIIIIFMLIISSITYIIFKRKKNYIMK